MGCSDDDVYHYIRWRLKLEGETENMGVCTKERKGVAAAVLMATPCTNSLGGESGERVDREKVGFTKNTARRHRRVGRRAVTVTAMLHRQRYRGIEKEKEKAR